MKNNFIKSIFAQTVILVFLIVLLIVKILNFDGGNNSIIQISLISIVLALGSFKYFKKLKRE